MSEEAQLLIRFARLVWQFLAWSVRVIWLHLTIVSGSAGVGDELCSSTVAKTMISYCNDRKNGTRHFVSGTYDNNAENCAVSLHWYRTKADFRFLRFQKALCTGLE